MAEPSPAVGTPAWTGERLEVDVPVPVITLGLPAATVAAMRTTLAPRQIDHRVCDFGQLLPLDQEPHESDPLPPDAVEFVPDPVLPRAVYRLSAAPPALEQAFAAALRAAELEPGLYDANRIEDRLLQALPQHGLAVSAGF